MIKKRVPHILDSDNIDLDPINYDGIICNKGR